MVTDFILIVEIYVYLDDTEAAWALHSKKGTRMGLFALLGLSLAALIVLVAVLSAIAPVRVTYQETIDVNAPHDQIYDDIRLQDHLMRWSAWPAETNSTCTVEPGEGGDGQVGARTVFYSKGKRFGHQEVVALTPNREVTLTLESKGPPHTPTLKFILTPKSETQTRVTLDFVNVLPRPFNALWRFAGLSAWTRKMHLKDLDGLKAFSAPPHRDATSTVVGHPPTGESPFEHFA